jgi:hypothetical protein
VIVSLRSAACCVCLLCVTCTLPVAVCSHACSDRGAFWLNFVFLRSQVVADTVLDFRADYMKQVYPPR